jgi:hypothetical protein
MQPSVDGMALQQRNMTSPNKHDWRRLEQPDADLYKHLFEKQPDIEQAAGESVKLFMAKVMKSNDIEIWINERLQKISLKLAPKVSVPSTQATEARDDTTEL